MTETDQKKLLDYRYDSALGGSRPILVSIDKRRRQMNDVCRQEEQKWAALFHEYCHAKKAISRLKFSFSGLNSNNYLAKRSAAGWTGKMLKHGMDAE